MLASLHHGFSLLELSIVLVIIGMLSGGVMTGQALIRAAELRSISTDVNRFTTAINAFRDRYQALPGDMKNATSFWGAAGTDLATCRTNSGTGTQTCSGDGNGRIGGDWITANNFENFRLWQHLANAGLIEGKYSGIAKDTANTSYFSGEVGVSLPASKLSQAGYYLFYLNETFADPNQIYAGVEGNTLFSGRNADWWMPDVPVLASDEAMPIDIKLDDGKPGIGRVMAPPPSSTPAPGCALGARSAPAAATYALTATGLKCTLVFRTGV